MSFTAQLGTPTSYLGAIELGINSIQSVLLSIIDSATSSDSRLVLVNIPSFSSSNNLLSDSSNSTIGKSSNGIVNSTTSDLLIVGVNYDESIFELIRPLESQIVSVNISNSIEDQELTFDEFLQAIIYKRTDLIISSDTISRLMFSSLNNIKPIKLTFSFKDSDIVVKQSNTIPTATIVVVGPEQIIKYKKN